MKLMIKILGLFVVCALVFFGCSKSGKDAKPSAFQTWMSENGKVKILSTTAMIDDLVGQIGRERIDHIALIVGEIDPHSYELVKGDDEKLSYAQIVFCNGLGLEHGASLRYRLQDHPNAVFLGDQIQQRYPDQILMVGSQKDPHIWMDVLLWSKAIDPIVESLSKIDPEFAAFYRENGNILLQSMKKIDQEIFQRLQNIPDDKRFLVTSHDAFNYFTRRYLASDGETLNMDWKRRFAAPEGLAPDGQLSAVDIQKMIDFLCLNSVGVVFPESNVSKDSLKKIVNACQEKGVSVRVSNQILYGDAMGAKGSDADSYLKIMQHNAETIANEWDLK